GGDLRQCQGHADDAPGKHMLAQGGKDQYQEEACQERHRHDREEIHRCPPDLPERSPAKDDTKGSNLEKTSSVPGRPPTSVATSTAVAPARFATSWLASAL